MAQGRTTALRVTLTHEDRHGLLHTSWASTTPWRLARRARIILLLDAGSSIAEIALATGIGRRHIYKWVARFQRRGLPGLTDERRGRLAPRHTPV